MFNQKLVDARLGKGWSPEEASERVSVALRTYLRWEAGTHLPQSKSLGMLLRTFGEPGKPARPKDLGFIVDKETGHVRFMTPADDLLHTEQKPKEGFGLADEKATEAPQRSLLFPLGTDTIVIQTSQVQIFIEPLPDETSRGRTIPSVQMTSPSGIQSQDIIGAEGGPMKKDRRNLMIALAGAPLVLPGMEQQDLVANVQRVLHQPSSGPSDKELKFLEQKIMLYWHARNNALLVPADLTLHVSEYVQDVKTLLDRSPLPSIRTRLCACLSQGMLLIGHSLDGTQQFQAARRYYHIAIESAHEANHNILQALAWYRNSRSWSYGNETNRYEQARESMLKACGFAALGSDFAVQCVALLGLAEVYAYLKEKEACLEALKGAGKLDGHGPGDWHFIHLFDSASLNGYRGACLQQFDQPDLLEEARQALEEALSQPNTSPLRRDFCMADMAQVYAREGKVESACDCAKQVISMAGTNASLRQSVLAVHTLLELYTDVQVVRDLGREIRVVLLQR